MNSVSSTLKDKINNVDKGRHVGWATIHSLMTTNLTDDPFLFLTRKTYPWTSRFPIVAYGAC